MKKLLAFLLAALMCLTLAACGGDAPDVTQDPAENTMSKEEMLAVAEECTATDIQNTSIENILLGKQQYCNKTLLLSGTVRNITEDHIELSATYSANYIIDVYMSVDDMIQLKNGQAITVVGTTTDEIIEDTETAAEYSFDYNHYQMPAAYLVEDRIEVTGILKGVNNSYAPAFNVEIGGGNVLKLVEFADDVDTSAFEFNQEVTFLAKAIYENSNWHYYDAQIVG